MQLARASLACQLATAEPVPVRTPAFSELAIYPQYSPPATVVSENQSRLSTEHRHHYRWPLSPARW